MLCNLTGYAMFSSHLLSRSRIYHFQTQQKQIISDTSKNQEHQISVFLFENYQIKCFVMLNYQSKLVHNWSTLIYLLHAQKAVIQAARPFLAVTNLPVGFSLWHL